MTAGERGTAQKMRELPKSSIAIPYDRHKEAYLNHWAKYLLSDHTTIVNEEEDECDERCGIRNNQ
jgi:hypothetical protein